MTVSEGPQVVGGANWYRIASLGGVTGWVRSGWVADPYLETILNDPVLIAAARSPIRCSTWSMAPQWRARSCGWATSPSRATSSTAPWPPSSGPGNPRGSVRDGAGRLRRASGTPVGTGSERMRPCGGRRTSLLAATRSRPGGRRFPADQGPGTRPPDPPGRAGGESAIEQHAVAADDDVARGCRGLRPGQHQHRRRRGPEPSRRDHRAVQHRDRVQRPESQAAPCRGWSTAWIKLPKDGSSPDDIPLERPIEVYISADVYPEGISSYAWSSFNYEREELA